MIHHINCLVSVHVYRYWIFSLDEVLSKWIICSRITCKGRADTFSNFMTCSFSLKLSSKHAYTSRCTWSSYRFSSFLLLEILKLNKLDFLSRTLLWKYCSLFFKIFRVVLSISDSTRAFLAFYNFSLDWCVILVSLLRLSLSSPILLWWNDTK